MTKNTIFKNALILATFLAVTPSVTVAQDITNEQRNAYEARQSYNNKMASHQNLKTRLSQQEKRVEEEQARLNKLIAEEQAASNELAQAKVDLDNKVKALNDVWDLRDR